MPTDRPAVPASRSAVDVSGRPLRLRDVDLHTFLNPKTIAVIGASEQSAKPNSVMTRKFSAWAAQHGATFYPVHPDLRDRARAQVLRVAGRGPRRSRSRDHPHRARRRHVRRGAAAQGEVRGDLRGRVLGDRHRGREARAAPGWARALGRRAPARPEHEPQRVRGVPRRPRRPVDRADHAVGSPGPPGVPGPGDRHPAHALGTDRQRGRPRVRRLRALLRRSAGSRCHRLLHRRVQGRPHVDARGRSRRAAAQADRDGEGRPHRGRASRWPRRTPATSPVRTPSRARCSGSSA